MLSLLISRMLICIFLLLSIIILLHFVCHINISGRFCHLHWLQVLRIFTSFTKPLLFLSQCKGFNIFIYLHDILAVILCMPAGKRAYPFCAPYCLAWAAKPNSERCPTQRFCFLVLFWDSVDMFVSLPYYKLLEYSR